MQNCKNQDLEKIERDDGKRYYTRLNNVSDCYRNGIKEWLIDQKPNYLLTANFNTRGTVEYGKNKLTQWYERVHEKLYNKRNFQLIKQDERVKMIGFPELTSRGMLHFHIISTIPLVKVERFKEIGEWQLGRILPASDLHIREIKQAQDGLGTLDDYVTKGSYAEAFWTGDLVPRRVCLDLQKRRVAVTRSRHSPWMSSNRFGYATR